MKNFFYIIACLTMAILASCVLAEDKGQEQKMSPKQLPQVTETALFAGGCFWCMEKPFEALDGVISVTSGYAGGTTKMPTYQNYAAGHHIEVVQVIYDPQNNFLRKTP